jgi:hypothetical protein
MDNTVIARRGTPAQRSIRLGKNKYIMLYIHVHITYRMFATHITSITRHLFRRMVRTNLITNKFLRRSVISVIVIIVIGIITSHPFCVIAESNVEPKVMTWKYAYKEP